MTLIEQIKKDVEAGSPGPWALAWDSEILHVVTVDGEPVAMIGSVADCSDAQRIARVPQMEAALLPAEELARVADCFLELMERHLKDHALSMEANRAADFTQGVTETKAALSACRAAMEADNG